MSHRCFIKIYSKHTIQELSDTRGSLSDNFSKCMDDFIAELPSRILERKIGLHLHDDMVDTRDIYVTSIDSHGSSRLPDILLEVTIELTSNGKTKRKHAEEIFTEIVQQHFEAANKPNLQVVVFVNNRS